MAFFPGLLVQKFGGTSVGTPERILSVAERIARSHSRGHPLVVVVSAMGDSTDDLINLAHQVTKNPPHREMDMLLTVGERISTALLSMALADLGIPAVSLTGSQSGIITDQSHRRARIQRILGDRIRSALESQKVVIVAGFQGVSETKEVTTLGRGGSDTTAVALAATLGAKICEIFTDVNGVYSADPRIVPNAKLWMRIPIFLMAEMANRGAGVLHPRSVELAKRYDVSLVVRNSLNESEGTVVIPSTGVNRKGMEDYDVVGVTADLGKFFITIRLARETVLGSVWDRAAQSHLSIVAPSFSKDQVSFFSDREGEADWRKNLEELSTDGYVKEYHMNLEIIPLSVIGNRFAQDGMALYGVFDILARHHVPVLHGCSSSSAMTLGIPANFVEEGIRALHSELLESANQ